MKLYYMQAPVAVRCFTNCYTLPLPLPLLYCPILFGEKPVNENCGKPNCIALHAAEAPEWRMRKGILGVFSEILLI